MLNLSSNTKLVIAFLLGIASPFPGALLATWYELSQGWLFVLAFVPFFVAIINFSWCLREPSRGEKVLWLGFAVSVFLLIATVGMLFLGPMPFWLATMIMWGSIGCSGLFFYALLCVKK